MIKVKDVMTQNPHTLLQSHTLADAKNTMQALDIRHIPIVNEHHHLLGLVSLSDVLSAQESMLQNDLDEQSKVMETLLIEVMTTHIKTISSKSDLKECALEMHKHKLGCFPVVEKGELVGIITDGDFIVIAIDLLERFEKIQDNS